MAIDCTFANLSHSSVAPLLINQMHLRPRTLSICLSFTTFVNVWLLHCCNLAFHVYQICLSLCDVIVKGVNPVMERLPAVLLQCVAANMDILAVVSLISMYHSLSSNSLSWSLINCLSCH
jgi:hypothetical protein